MSRLGWMHAWRQCVSSVSLMRWQKRRLTELRTNWLPLECVSDIIDCGKDLKSRDVFTAPHYFFLFVILSLKTALVHHTHTHTHMHIICTGACWLEHSINQKRRHDKATFRVLVAKDQLYCEDREAKDKHEQRKAQCDDVQPRCRAGVSEHPQ